MMQRVFDPNIPAENAQEFFDRTCEHLAVQKRRAVNRNDFCLYRAPGGLMCAIGCHLPDRLVGLNDNGLSIRTAYLKYSGWRPFIPSLLLAIALQIIHDRADHSGCDFLKRRLYEVAERFNLDPAAVEYIEEWEC